MAENEYIERNALLDDLDAAMKNSGMGYVVGQTMKRYIKRVPAADVAPVVHAEWVVEEERTGNYSHCSRCGIRCQGYAPNYKFCPNCGAKMDGERKE